MTGAEQLAFADVDTVERYQVEQLRRLIRYVSINSPFYRTRLDIDPNRVRSTGDIRGLPCTSRQDLQASADELYCCPRDLWAEMVCTSGSTGARPITHPLTESDLERLAYNEQLSLSCAGIAAGDTVLISVAMDGLFIAGLAYYLGLRRIGARAVRTGPADLQLQLKVLSELPVTTVIGVPTNLIALADASGPAGLSHVLRGKRLVLIGETIRDQAFALGGLGRRLADAWPGSRLMSTYGNTELATAFCECERGRGGHAHPDLVYVELIDEDGNPVPQGAVGELVVTTFHATAMPLLRYRTGDLTFILTDRCECGRTSPRIGPIIGRREQMLKVRGVSTSPAAVADAVTELDYVVDYVIVAVGGDSGSDEIEIYVVVEAESPGHCEQQVAEFVRSRARVRPRVTVATEEELGRLQYGAGSRKPRRFVDRRGSSS